MTARPRPKTLADLPPTTPCPRELSELLAQTRKDTTADDWRGAILAAQTAGLSWTDTWFEIALILKHGGGPDALRDKVRHLPPRRTPQDTP